MQHWQLVVQLWYTAMVFVSCSQSVSSAHFLSRWRLRRVCGNN